MIVAWLVTSGQWPVDIHARPGEFFGTLLLACVELTAEVAFLFL